MKEGRDNPSVRCGGQLPLHSSHRLSSSSCAGVAVGLFSEKSTPYSFLQNARPSAALRPAKGGAEGGGNPSVCCGGQLPLTCFSRKRPAKGEPKEGTIPQSAAADSSPYILRTEIAFQAIPVLRMAYFTKRPYYGLFVKTHMLQPQAACEGGSRRRGNPLSPLRRTAPLTQGSRRRGQPVSLGAMRMRMKKGGG